MNPSPENWSAAQLVWYLAVGRLLSFSVALVEPHETCRTYAVLIGTQDMPGLRPCCCSWNPHKKRAFPNKEASEKQ